MIAVLLQFSNHECNEELRRATSLEMSISLRIPWANGSSATVSLYWYRRAFASGVPTPVRRWQRKWGEYVCTYSPHLFTTESPKGHKAFLRGSSA